MKVNNSSLVCCWVVQCTNCGKKCHWHNDCLKLKK